MAIATKTLGTILNASLKEIGEPEISTIDTDNILQVRLIEVANNAVRELRDRLNYDWTLQRATLSTNADITTESAAVTNGDATVNSVTSAGANADNWGSVTTSMWFRAASTQKSYQISSITTSGSPHTLELETTYLDSTSTAIGYRIFQDTYSVSTAGFGELVEASYGDSGSWASGIQGYLPNHRLVVVPFSRLMQLAGGDRHRDTSGRPRVICQIGADSSDNPQFILWPYPTDTYLIELFYTLEYAENETFNTVMFGADAPSSAYDFVEHKVVAAAHEWDTNYNSAATYEQRAQIAIANVIRRENRERIDFGFDVETYRRHYGIRYPGRSGIFFDTVLRRR
jgi:hypothetical protein